MPIASSRLERASFWALVTAFLAGMTFWGFTMSPVLPANFFRTALIVLVGSYAGLAALIAVWYFTLKVCGR